MKRILIGGTNWVGDAVMSLAAIRELRQLFPHSHLALLVRKWVSGLFEGQQIVDEIITFEDQQRTFSQIWTFPKKLSGFDIALLFPNAFRTALIAFVAGIPERIGYATDGRRFLLTRHAQPRIRKLGRHQVYYYLDLLHLTRLSPVDYLNDGSFRPNIRLYPTSRGIHQAELLLRRCNPDPTRRLVAFSPGAYFGPAKRWPSDCFASLADRLITEQKVEVLILGTSEDLRIAEEIQRLMRKRVYILVGQTQLEDLIGLISRCRLFVTNDSGPMHLSAALDVPQVALFGSTDERATGPLSERAVVIHKHVECSPCFLRECPIDLRCFYQIEVDKVYETACSLLDHA